MFKTAVIGCGGIAEVHKRVLMSIPEVELVACCDIKPEKARNFAEGTSLRWYENLEEMLSKEALDSVHICVPHPLHTPIAHKCAAMGLHVFTEKPPVVSYEQWEEFSKLKDYKTYTGICFQNRYNYSVKKAKELLLTSSLGAVKGARAFLTWNRAAEYYTESDWRGAWDTEGGGCLINQAIHTLDLLVYLLGKPEEVMCHMSNHSLKNVIEVEDTVEAYIKFENNIGASFYATNAYCDNAPVLIDIKCENGNLRLEGNTLTVTYEDGSKEDFSDNMGPQFAKDYWGNSHYTCISDFYDAISSGRPFENDINSVSDTMKLMLEMYRPFTGKNLGEN